MYSANTLYEIDESGDQSCCGKTPIGTWTWVTCCPLIFSPVRGSWEFAHPLHQGVADFGYDQSPSQTLAPTDYLYAYVRIPRNRAPSGVGFAFWNSASFWLKNCWEDYPCAR